MSESKNTGKGVHKTKLDYNDAMFLLEVEGLARDGYDDQQIAEILDVAPETFCRNKRKKQTDGSLSQLSQALSRGRRPLSVIVENAMYKRAIGGATIKSTVTRFMVLPDGTKTDTEIVQVTETELAADVVAGFKWLQVHKPDMYNAQPQKIDMTSNGKDINAEIPRITKISHIVISDANIKHMNIDDAA